MKNYQVNIAIKDFEIVVEANSVDEAVDLAWVELTEHDLYSPLSVDHAYIADVVEVEENDDEN
jgi:hypothetical protein